MWLKSKKCTILGICDDVENLELANITDGKAKRYIQFNEQFVLFFFNKLTTHLLYDPTISFYLSKRNENFGSQEDLYVNVDSGFFIIHKPRNKPDIL